MNIIERADAWIVSRIYQPLVDLSGLTPAWWVRCMGILILCAEAARFAAGYRPEGLFLASWILHILITAAIPVGSPTWAVRSLRIDRFTRLTAVTLIGTWIVLQATAVAMVAILSDSLIPQRIVLRFVADVAVLSVLFFAVCKDPPPPRRSLKPSLATSRGSA